MSDPAGPRPFFVDLGRPPLDTATGRGIRVAVIDSGVHAEHPHVGGVAGGVGIGLDGSEHGDFVDRLGHGTAVTAAILEKAPEVELWSIKVFDQTLSAPTAALVRSIDWAASRGVQLINLSLGTDKPEREDELTAAVEHAASRGALVVSAAESDGTRWLPGGLAGAVGVGLDWDCPREALRIGASRKGTAASETDGSRAPPRDGRVVLLASGYPRPIPGVSPERNLKGISFAVANVTGILARVLEATPPETGSAAEELVASLLDRLVELAVSSVG